MLTALVLSSACERTGPCAAYDRTAEAVKDGAKITYCLSRNGIAQGPYTCVLENGLGAVEGRYKDGRRVGRWSFYGPGGVLIRHEGWQDDRKVSTEELQPTLPPLPEDVPRLDCDGHFIRRADVRGVDAPPAPKPGEPPH